MKDRNILKQLDDHLAQLFIIPGLICLIVFVAYPAILTIYNSMTNLSMLTMRATKFVGLKNYVEIISGEEFWISLLNGIKYTFYSLIGQFFIGYIAALSLEKIIYCKSVFRVLLLTPWTFPSIALTFLFSWMLDPSFGIINFILEGLNIIDNPIPWFGAKNTALFSVIMMNIWFGFPFIMLTLLSGFQTIPNEYFEVAEIEGLNFIQKQKYVILPNLKKVFGVLLILRTIWIFNNYDFIFLTTGGGPGISSQTVPIYSYITAWKRMAMGRGSAITILLLIFVGLFIAIYFKVFGMSEKESNL